MEADIRKTDAQIRRDTLDELERHWRFKPAEIGVEVDSGVVTLSGTVTSYAKLLAAADVASTIAGVKGVANELVVRVPGLGVPSDAEIAASVATALRVDPDVNEDAVEIVVRDGIVTLKGTVGYWYQRNAAEEGAGRIAGVVSVKNAIRVIPPTRTDAELKDEIERSLRRRVPLAVERIRVSVTDGVVTLRGNVEFYSDRVQAEKSAWMTEGVRNVVNSLTTTW
ncbi:MAG TPA: BON domain-containing protein [Candidatus Limnocylindria bacterium]